MLRRLTSLIAGIAISVSIIADERTLPLRHERREVVTQYARLAAVPLLERRDAYAATAARMRSDLWTLHLEYFLSDHPELTTEHRSVIYEALGLLASGILDISGDPSRWQAEIEPLLRNLQTRAQQVLPPGMASAVLAELGPSSNVVGDAVNGPLPRWRVVPNGYECECSTESDWCCAFTQPTCPTPTCRASQPPFGCTPTSSGCGTFWMYGCNGMCGA